MSTNKEIVSFAIDVCKGAPKGYSLDEGNKALNKMLVEANHGKSRLDIRDVRDGKCGDLFAIIENVIVDRVEEGLKGNEFFMDMVEYHNAKLGDTNEFYIPDDSLFYVSEVARGTQGLRRQRVSGGTTVSTKVKSYGVKVYEELDRLLAEQTDMGTMVAKVADSIAKKRNDDIFEKWTSLINNPDGSAYYPAAGSYNEEALLTLCEHVEAETGSTPVIMGTRTALRKCTTADTSEVAKTDKYNIGYYGKFNGIPMVRIHNVHKTNTDTFILPDNKIYVLPTSLDNKPIKYFTEGDALIVPPGFAINGDFSEDYLYLYKAGIDVIMPHRKFGVYTITP